MPKRSADARRGALGALVANLTPVANPGETFQEVPLDQLRPSPLQARRSFDPAALQDLAASLRAQGVLQPLLVRPLAQGYEIVAGERRWRAAQLAGLSSVPVVARDLSDEEAHDAGAIENLQREDLNVIDEVDLVVGLVARTLGLTPGEVPARLHAVVNRPQEDPAAREQLEELFARLGRGTWTSFVKNKLRVLRWPQPVLQAMRERGLGYSVAGVVAAAPAEHQGALLHLALSGASKAELRERLLSFRKDKPLDPTANVVRALQNKRRLAALSEQERRRVDRLVRELERLLGEGATPGSGRARGARD
ncbi:ParB/RepB/Spo0J family partition protein [Deinococcus budaensis]|uniref:ParB family chromosome partitioning protein n=1 Tax=Deinococcus budaensis TaxID=1665626 RepID=A0A7W8GHS9_9DEIO|nr:ParB family chromosome partitioning protein [Deinococcus budaensis]